MSRAALSALVLCAVLVTGGACSGEGGSRGEVPQGGDQGAAGTMPGLTRVESRVVDALARLSLHGQRAELPGPDGASIWVPETEQDPLQDPLQVAAYPVSSSRGEATVVDERPIGGVTVETIEFTSGIVQRRFDCDGTTYGIAGATPAGFDDLDAFLVAFVEALGCDG